MSANSLESKPLLHLLLSSAPNGITRGERDDAVNLLLKHFADEYQLVFVNAAIVSRAVALTQNYRLRAYDAVQLATALAANEQSIALRLPTLTILTADKDMLNAARNEGLTAEDPNAHL